MAGPSFASRVVRWQTQHGRNNLPWQNTRDPYRVWLSEVMLQQTQVATVHDYFLRFVERFPTVRDLAAASPDEVLGLWSGLGYYSRARNLHRCAQRVVEHFDGVFPQTSEQLVLLPGIGRSTAAAIASLCFGERVAILDANVKRVLARVLAFGADLGSTANQRLLWEAAQQLLPRRDLQRSMPRYTQGMMDLGATICLPRQPQCAACPVAGQCAARRMDAPLSFPNKTRRLTRSAISVWLLWAQRADGSVWLQRRAPSGVWGGLYCMPWFDSRQALVDALPARQRLRLCDEAPFKHVLTHKELTLHPVRVDLPLAFDDLRGGRWVGADLWPALGLPAPVRELLAQDGNQPKDVLG